MAGESRQNFKAAVVAICAKNANYLCSNPTCRTPTAQQGTDPMRPIITGEAAHIRAAAPGGPRYDANQTDEQRGDIRNAIWLCRKCARTVDRDPAAYPPAKLEKWLEEHRRFLADDPATRDLETRLSTHPGLTLPDTPNASMTPEQLKHLREHSLLLRNPSSQEMRNIQLRLQMPEAIVDVLHVDVPTGTAVDFDADRARPMVMGSGTAVRLGGPQPIGIWKLGLSALPSQSLAEITFRTAIVGAAEAYYRLESRMDAGRDNAVSSFIGGSWQVQSRSMWTLRRCLYPIAYDRERRTMSADGANQIGLEVRDSMVMM